MKNARVNRSFYKLMQTKSLKTHQNAKQNRSCKLAFNVANECHFRDEGKLIDTKNARVKYTLEQYQSNHRYLYTPNHLSIDI